MPSGQYERESSSSTEEVSSAVGLTVATGVWVDRAAVTVAATVAGSGVAVAVVVGDAAITVGKKSVGDG